MVTHSRNYDATTGHPWSFLLFLLFRSRPATEAPNSRSESAQKTTVEGTNWEIFGFDWGSAAECTAIFQEGWHKDGRNSTICQPLTQCVTHNARSFRKIAAK
jgi:hypothetical protein